MENHIEHCCSYKSKERPDKEYKDLINRLSRIEGQVRGIKKMVENDTYCTEIGIHIREGKDETIDELVKVLQKLMK